MDFLKGNVRRIFFRYFIIVYASSLISSVYGSVDTAMVGQYHGPAGSAAISVIMPVFSLTFSFAILCGLGGSIRFGTERGRKSGIENEYFTVSVILTLILSALNTALVYFFRDPMVCLMGADDALFPLARAYVITLTPAVPAFMIGAMLASYLRNDGSPGIATAATLAGGIFNVAGDYYFVFVRDMGIAGAGLATSIGAYITLLVTLSHFFLKRSTLRLVRPTAFCQKCGKVLVSGFATFFTDLAAGIVIMIFNRKIMQYLGGDALAVYGVLGQVACMVLCASYSIGGAAQPILSVNFGAKQWGRIKETLKYALCTCAAMGVVWMTASMLFPNFFIRIFMKPTPEVLAIAPRIFRVYSTSYLLLTVNVFSTYYFQSLLKARTSFAVSVGRGVAVSGALICLLPVIAPGLIWWAMPLAELIVGAFVIYKMVSYTKHIETCAI